MEIPLYPPQKKGADPLYPQFWAHFYCGQTAACIKMPLGMEVGLSPGYFVLDEDPAPKFSAHVYCGKQMKLVLGTDVGLSPGDFVLNGDPAPPPPKLSLIHI